MLTQTSRYPYEPIIDRQPLAWPDGKYVAVVPYLNIEHFPEDLPGTPLVPMTQSFKPDVLNYGWRDYGQRVGIWRIMEILDRHSMRATVCLNSDVCREYPRIIEEGNLRDWEWMGHGQNNSNFLNGIEEDVERELISTVVKEIEQGTGKRPKGWLGPFLSETPRTPDLLVEAGIEYLCDFTCDDQPFALTTAKGSLLSMPYTVELNDIPAFLNRGESAASFGQSIRDQFDVLYAEGATNARVMPICLHTFLIGQPFRAKHLNEAFAYIAEHEHVWFPTAGEINDWYRALHSS